MAFNRQVRRHTRQLRQKNIALRNRLKKGGRRGPLSIPKVNQNPRPPNEVQPSGASGGTNVGPLAPATDPRDSQYYRDLAQFEFNKATSISELDTQDVMAKTGLESALQRRSFDEPVEVQRQREGANVGGNIYSTAHQEDLGRLAQQQFQTRSDIDTDYRNSLVQRELQRQALLAQYELDLQNALGEGAERASEAELDREGPLIEDIFGGGGGGGGGSAQTKALIQRIKALQVKRKQVQSSKAKKTITKKIHTLQKKRRR